MKISLDMTIIDGNPLTSTGSASFSATVVCGWYAMASDGRACRLFQSMHLQTLAIVLVNSAKTWREAFSRRFHCAEADMHADSIDGIRGN
jgi:hypothetical protein